MANSKNKDLYRQLCIECMDIPLFMQAWWMDAVCIAENKKWDVFLVEQNSSIIAAMPYHFFKKLGFNIIIQPQHTQYNGVWFQYPKNQTINERLSYEKMAMTQIIHQINESKISLFQQNFHFNFTNWHPFYWNGFQQTTRYTYILNDISNTDIVFQNFHTFKQKHIKKAQRDLKVDFDLKADEFHDFHSQSLRKSKNKIFYSKELFKSIVDSATTRNQGKIIAIRDKDNNLHSAAFVVWDFESAYYLISAINPDSKSSGASSLMVWEAIKYLSDKSKKFDFEGSMIENVAKSFEEFGAVQTPYFKISKYNLFFSFLSCFKVINL